MNIKKSIVFEVGRAKQTPLKVLHFDVAILGLVAFFCNLFVLLKT
jgi:hypothetical protein